LNRIPGLATPQDLADLKDQLASRMDIISRRVREIHDPQRAIQAQGLLAQMRQDEATVGGNGIFATAERILATQSRILDL
jgi:hypothetical protein